MIILSKKQEEKQVIFSLFGTHYKMVPTEQITLDEFVSAVRNGRWKIEVSAVREALQKHGRDSDEHKAAKAKLPAITLSASCSSRSADKSVEDKLLDYNHIIQVDFDLHETPEVVREFREQLSHDPHILFAAISPSGDGVKAAIIYKTPSEIEEQASYDNLAEIHKAVYLEVDSYLWSCYEIHNDPAVKDIFRICYILDDPEIYYNPEAIPLELTIRLFKKNETPTETIIKSQDDKLTKKSGDKLEGIVQKALDKVMSASQKTRQNITLQQAVHLGTYVGGGYLDEADIKQRLLAAVKANPSHKASDEKERLTAIDNGVAYGKQNPKVLQTRDSNDTRKEWIFPFGQQNDAGAKKLLAELTDSQEFFSKPNEKAVFVVANEKEGSEMRTRLAGVSEVQLEAAITDRYRIVEEPDGDEKELGRRDLTRIWANGQIKFPVCSGVVRVPILHEDGTWKTEDGYDPQTKYYLKGSWKLNLSPTKEETKEALDYILNQVWGEYSFDDSGVSKGVGKSVLLSLILSGLYIPITEIRPGYIVTAARRDSGKTKLASTINALIDDQISVKDLQRGADDLERTIEGDKRNGIRIHTFDNLKDGRSLYESKIAMVLTAPTIKQKKLHSNDSIQTKNDFIQIYTGNNISATDDNTRRYFLLYIQRQTDKEFRHEPVSFVRKNRDKIIQAVATLINAYRESGSSLISPKSVKSFEKWDRVVRQNILWLAKKFPEFGIGDPIENIEQQEETNPRDIQIRHLLEVISNTFSEDKFSGTMVGDELDLVRGNKEFRQAFRFLVPNSAKDIHENTRAINEALKSIRNNRQETQPGKFVTLVDDESKNRNQKWWRVVVERNDQEKSVLDYSTDENVVRRWRRKSEFAR